jgi:glycosyltransferase involved in cell wall biosynthesis
LLRPSALHCTIGPVWVVVDGSSDGSDIALERALCPHAGLHVIRLTEPRQGCGSPAALRRAHAEGFTHACTLDSDGQHRAADIP